MHRLKPQTMRRLYLTARGQGAQQATGRAGPEEAAVRGKGGVHAHTSHHKPDRPERLKRQLGEASKLTRGS